MEYLIPKSKIEEIERLYYQKELSAREIASKIDVSMTTIYRFMNRHRIKRRNPKELSILSFQRKPPTFNLHAQHSFQLKKLKTAGVIMYWCEGATSQKAKGVDFTNSKPEMIEIFMAFLRKVCGVSDNKLRAMIYCHKNQDIAVITRFWSNLTSIPKSQFTKPYIRDEVDKDENNKMPYGLIHVRYFDKKLLIQLKAWIDEEIVQLIRNKMGR